MCPEKKLDAAAKLNNGHVNQINVEEVTSTFPFNSFTALNHM
jgi:hypothetical protein